MPANEIAGGELFVLGALDGLVESPVEGLERLMLGKLGGGDANVALQALSGSGAQLADPLVLERPRRAGNISIHTLGVMPAGFQFPSSDVDLWNADDADAPYAQSRALTWFTGIGRLRPGVQVKAVLVQPTTPSTTAAVQPRG